jgi:hypothetical protein
VVGFIQVLSLIHQYQCILLPRPPLIIQAVVHRVLQVASSAFHFRRKGLVYRCPLQQALLEYAGLQREWTRGHIRKAPGVSHTVHRSLYTDPVLPSRLAIHDAVTVEAVPGLVYFVHVPPRVPEHLQTKGVDGVNLYAVRLLRQKGV